MPRDMFVRQPPYCHRTMGGMVYHCGRNDHDSFPESTYTVPETCKGSACALWVDKTDRFDDSDLEAALSVLAPNGEIGLCRDNPDATPWRDPAATPLPPE